MRGFTLLETLIYLTLFTILFIGIIGSSVGFFTGAEQVSALVVKENESAFVVRKINTLLNSANAIVSPTSGNGGSILTFTTYAGDEYTITTTNGALTLKKNNNPASILTAERVSFSNFSTKHTPQTGGLPRFFEYSFNVNGEVFGPIRIYVTF